MPAPRRASSISGQTARCARTYSSIRSGRTWRTNAVRCVMRPPHRSASQLLVCAFDRRGAAFARELGRVASLAEGGDGIVRDAELLPEAAEQRAHVLLERFEENAVRAEHVA